MSPTERSHRRCRPASPVTSPLRATGRWTATSTLAPMARIRLFAAAREAAGTGSDIVDGTTVAEVLAAATQRYGSRFDDVLRTCRVWVNGDDVSSDTAVGPDDEVAVLPPVSGGST